jgi:ribonuclease BN (tRNA processing enzyme)
METSGLILCKNMIKYFNRKMAEIKFLGTGGARFVVAKQLRYSAGIFISSSETNLILDPGPGALLRLASSRPKIDVEKIDGVILTHVHLDHSNDVNILIDSLTEGGFKKKGVLFAPKEAYDGDNRVILPYILPFLDRTEILVHNRKFSIGNIEFESFRHFHTAETYGIKMNLESKIVSFIVDTKFFDGLLDFYRFSDILVINVVLLEEKPEIMHLSIHDAKMIITELKPQKAILTHFGMGIIRAHPFMLADRLSQELGLNVIAASDGMKVVF